MIVLVRLTGSPDSAGKRADGAEDRRSLLEMVKLAEEADPVPDPAELVERETGLFLLVVFVRRDPGDVTNTRKLANQNVKIWSGRFSAGLGAGSDGSSRRLITGGGGSTA